MRRYVARNWLGWLVASSAVHREVSTGAAEGEHSASARVAHSDYPGKPGKTRAPPNDVSPAQTVPKTICWALKRVEAVDVVKAQTLGSG